MEFLGQLFSGSLRFVINLAIFVLAIGLLAFVHELGHFLFSRLFNIEVEEFGFGLPPRWKKLFTWKGTEFTLNKIPFGAFVRPKGENDPAVPGGLAAAKPGVRFLVFIGGPLMNLIAAGLIFTLVTAVDGVVRTTIGEVTPDTPAAQAGFQKNDVFLQIDNHKISPHTDVSSLVYSKAGQQTTFIMERNGQPVTLIATPRTNPPEGQGPLGIMLRTKYEKIPLSFPQEISYGFGEVWYQSHEVILLPVRLISGQFQLSQARPISVVGAFQVFVQVQDIQQENINANPQSASRMLVVWLFGTISVALGIFNLLPLPALDGGHILFLIPELILRRRVPHEFENAVHAAGLLLLLAFMVVLVVNDIVNPLKLP